MANTSPSSAAQTSNNGIRLNASLDTVSLAQGGNLTISIEAFNTLSSYNNVSSNTGWAFQSLVGQCKGGLFNDALYSGFYASSNISSATPIPWRAPGPLLCPRSGNYSHYSFDPSSNMLTAVRTNSSVSVSISASTQTEVYTSCSLNNQTSTMSDGSTVTSYSTSFCITSTSTSIITSPQSSSNPVESSVRYPAIASYQVNGYYDASLAQFVHFAPGEYSLLVGDIWGSYVILHFGVN